MVLQQPLTPRAPRPAAAHPGWGRTPLHRVLGAVGPLTGLAAAVAVHLLGGSPTAVLVTLAVVAGVLGLALPDAVVGPRRLARVAFALVPVAGSVAGFLLAAALWAPTWPALLLCGVGGSAFGSALQPVLFPGLARERGHR